MKYTMKPIYFLSEGFITCLIEQKIKQVEQWPLATRVYVQTVFCIYYPT